MSWVSRKRMYCSVYGCLENSYKNPKLSFFNIPKEPEKRKQWLQKILREDLNQKTTIYRICEKHFNEEDILKSENAVRKRLKKNTVPSLNLLTRPTGDKHTQTQLTVSTSSSQTDQLASIKSENTFNNASCQTDQMMSENLTHIADSLSANTSQTRRLKSELKGGQKRLKVLEIQQTGEQSQQDMFHKLCNRFLSNDLAELVKAQTYFKSNCKGITYSLEYKMFCLNLFHVSPQAYRLLEKTICLPSKVALSKFCIQMSTHVNDNLMEALKIKVNKMSDAEKHCTLVVNAMSLKTNLYYDIKNDKIIGFHEVDGIQSPTLAKYALVVLIRGIFEKWSQPIGFALIAECKNDDNISKWIDKLVLKLFEIGLKIRAFVSDLESDNLDASNKRGISPDKTHFIINGHKIYYIFDAPRLVTLVRNNLLTYDFHFGNKAVAKFEHIRKFYEHDKNKTVKQAYKLTNSHINPSNSEKKKIRYATQLLSRSVAAGISTCIDIRVVDESAKHTVELIKLMNDLFDALNSSVFHHTYTYKRAFHGDESQIDFLNNMLLFFQTLKLMDSKTGHEVTKGVKFIQGFQITIKSILRLHEDLQQEGYQYLLTRRLNQEITENYFGKIRSKNGKTTDPTSKQFVCAFRKKYFANLNQLPKEGACAEGEDLSKFLLHLENFETRFKDSSNSVNPSSIDEQGNYLREILRSDYTEFDIPEENAFLYICGALMKKCINYHKDCEILKSYLDDHEQAGDLLVVPVPPDDFVENIKKLEQVFRKAFQKQYLNRKIGLSIYEEMNEIELKFRCPYFPKQYLIKLYTRMRIYFTLKNNNQVFRSSRNGRKYFSVTNL